MANNEYKDTVLGYNYDDLPEQGRAQKILKLVLVIVLIALVTCLFVFKDDISKAIVERRLVSADYYYDYIDSDEMLKEIMDCYQIEEDDFYLEVEAQIRFDKDGIATKTVCKEIYFKGEYLEKIYNHKSGQYDYLEDGYYLRSILTTDTFEYELKNSKEMMVVVDGVVGYISVEDRGDYFVDHYGVIEPEGWLYSRY